MSQDTCSIVGCESPRKSYGWCAMHYGRWKRNGDPLSLHKQPSPLERFHTKYSVDPDSGCWVWHGTLDTEGYSFFKAERRQWHGHRWAYIHLVGPIADGLHLDHLCRRPSCVNPDHLEPVTCQENLLRSPITQASLNVTKTHCKHGHEFTQDNIYRAPKRPNTRGCLVCRRSGGVQLATRTQPALQISSNSTRAG